jgi:CubicO group peptidase (beta-lactamase class C family)
MPVMKARLPTLVVLLVLWSAPAARAQASAPPRPAPPSDAVVASRVDEFMNAEVRVNGFTGTVLLARKGVPLVSKGYAMANLEWQIPNTPQTKFRLGSITKQFTSMAIMQLQQTGKLKVEDSICQHVSPCPDAWKPITIHHLLTHTSGIPSYTNSPAYARTMMVPKTHEEMIGSFRDLPLEFAPGEQYKYNNSGYYLLGVIAEKLAGKKYEDVVRDQILKPLGMADTGYDFSETVVPKRAAGYSRDGVTVHNAPYVNMSQPYAAGGMYSTVEDLLKWDQALYTDKLLPEAARKAMWTPFKANYAYGWAVPSVSPATFNRVFVQHGGGINGFSTMIIRVPDETLTAIVLANSMQAPAGRIAKDLVAILLGEPYTVAVERTTATIDPKILDALVGVYEIVPAFQMTVTREGDQLFVQATKQPKFPLFPESETKFFLKVVDAQVTFVKDDTGAVSHLILHQLGKDQKARKLPAQ